MNTNLKNVLIFAVGAGVGSLLTWQIMNEKHEQELEDQYNAILEEFEREDYIETIKEYDTVDIVSNDGDVVKKIIRYNKPSLEEVIEADISQGPYIIDARTFDALEPDYIHDKVSLTYYQIDEVLVDSDDEMITNVYDLIGNEALACFGKYSPDPDIVHVRNQQLGIDYEIARVYKSYQVTILGIKDDEPPRKKVKNGTKAKE